MLSDELRGLCKRWLGKANKYGDATEDVFDKFFSLYVIYNAIYFEVTMELINSQKISNKRRGDRVSETKNIPEYIGQNNLSERLLSHTDDIKKIIDLIKNETFYISTKNDNVAPDYEKDQEFIDDIETFYALKNRTNQKRFNEALLSLIYGARCNMFHGKKDLQSKQIDLLVSMNSILLVIITTLLEKK